MKKLITAFFTLLLVACTTEQEEKAFSIIGDYYGAKVTSTKGFSSQVGKKNQNYINLYLKGGPYIGVEDSKKLAAYAAVLFYVNLSEEEVSKYTQIQVSLFENKTQKDPIYNTTYDVETLRNIAALSTNFQKAGELLLNGTPSEIYELIAEKNRVPGEKEQFESVIEKMKIERSGIKSVKLLGVELLINNDTKERFLSFNGEVKWGNDTATAMTVRTSEDPKIKGITNLNIK
ncbi:hypothetical protein [Aequorivita soesokkakensis]|nr:hypothetical protein [Aequorivita soesokkakensis]